MAAPPLRVGIVGYGSLGQFLVERIQNEPSIEIAWVWNRSPNKIPPTLPVLEDLADFGSRHADLIVEVAHPDITRPTGTRGPHIHPRQYGEAFLKSADFYMGSPTAMADEDVARGMRALAMNSSVPGSLYIPVGALVGAEDIQRMADAGTLSKLSVAMKKHPSSLKLMPPLSDKLLPRSEGGVFESGVENVVYAGPVRELCPMAPNNVNTMACAAIAGHNLGFAKTEALLVADDRLVHEHRIEIRMEGPGGYFVEILRSNPAAVGSVTGQQTYVSFFNSLLRARGRGKGVFFC